MGVVDKIESALHIGGHDHQHHHGHDHKTETTTTKTGLGGVTTKTSSEQLGTQGSSVGGITSSGSPASASTEKTHTTETTSAAPSTAQASAAQHATSATAGQSTAEHGPVTAAPQSQAAGTTTAGTVESVHEVKKEEHPAGVTTTVTKTLPIVGAGQHDGPVDHPSARTDTPLARHDQLHETVDFKPNLENPAAIPTAGGKDIGAGVVDHNATGTIGKDLIDSADAATHPSVSGSDHSAQVKPTTAASTNEHAVQADAPKNVTDPATSTGPGSTISPASAGLTTTGLAHDNTPAHSTSGHFANH